jgi:uncharacterized protein (DUF1778 family)
MNTTQAPRRDKNLNRKRTEAIRVMVTPEEWDIIQAAADLSGLPVSIYVRMMALAAARRDAEKAA